MLAVTVLLMMLQLQQNSGVIKLAIKAKLAKLDHPIVFALSVTLVVVGTISVLSWAFSSLGWNGPLSVLKGGFLTPSGGPAPQ